jgi:hypothetical protein
MVLTTDNDGVRTTSIKFVEAAILCYTTKSADSEIKGKSFSADMVPRGHPLLNPDDMGTEVRCVARVI